MTGRGRKPVPPEPAPQPQDHAAPARAERIKAALAKTREGRGTAWASLDLEQTAPIPRFMETAAQAEAAAQTACDAGIEAPPDPPSEPEASALEDSPPRQNALQNRALALCRNEQVQESIRGLRSHFLVRMKKQRGKSVLLTSTEHGEGRSFIALHLAVNLAEEAGRPVTLVDADLQRAGLTKELGLEAELGLQDWLAGTADATGDVFGIGVPGLSVLPAGRLIAKGQQMLGIERMGSLVNHLRSRDPDAFLLFDGPPLSEGAGALLLSGLTDGVLLVAQAERTRAQSIRRSVEALAHQNLLGTVLNKARV